jgi:hypothetical protein
LQLDIERPGADTATATSTRTVIIDPSGTPLVPDYTATTAIPAAASSFPQTVASSTAK